VDFDGAMNDIDEPGLAERSAKRRDDTPNRSGVPASLRLSHHELAVK